MSIAFLVLALEGGQIDPPHRITGSRNSQGGIGLMNPYLSGVKS